MITINSPSAVWIQKDGTKISLRDMTQSHLKNSIALLKRNREKIESQWPQVYMGDSPYAEDAVESENTYMQYAMDDIDEKIHLLESELSSRL